MVASFLSKGSSGCHSVQGIHRLYLHQRLGLKASPPVSGFSLVSLMFTARLLLCVFSILTGVTKARAKFSCLCSGVLISPFLLFVFSLPSLLPPYFPLLFTLPSFSLWSPFFFFFFEMIHLYPPPPLTHTMGLE